MKEKQGRRKQEEGSNEQKRKKRRGDRLKSERGRGRLVTKGEEQLDTKGGYRK